MAYKIGDTVTVGGKTATIKQIIHNPKEFGQISENPSPADQARGNPLVIESTEYLVDIDGVQQRVKF